MNSIIFMRCCDACDNYVLMFLRLTVHAKAGREKGCDVRVTLSKEETHAWWHEDDDSDSSLVAIA